MVFNGCFRESFKSVLGVSNECKISNSKICRLFILGLFFLILFQECSMFHGNVKNAKNVSNSFQGKFYVLMGETAFYGEK